jgi:hypothetical protein
LVGVVEERAVDERLQISFGAVTEPRHDELKSFTARYREGWVTLMPLRGEHARDADGQPVVGILGRLDEALTIRVLVQPTYLAGLSTLLARAGGLSSHNLRVAIKEAVGMEQRWLAPHSPLQDHGWLHQPMSGNVLTAFIGVAVVTTVYQGYRGFMFQWVLADKQRWTKPQKVVLLCVADGLFYLICTASGFLALFLAIELSTRLKDPSEIALGTSFLLAVYGILGVTGQLPSHSAGQGPSAGSQR